MGKFCFLNNLMVAYFFRVHDNPKVGVKLEYSMFEQSYYIF